MSGTEVDVTDGYLSINVIRKENLVQENNNVDGMDDLMEMILMHSCIQSDLGEPKDWKEELTRSELEWCIKSITAEFNNFISRCGYQFVILNQVIESGRKLVPTKLLLKKKDEINGSLRFKARNVTLIFMIVPRVDFTESFSPLAAHASLKNQLEINVKKYKDGQRAHACDIEAAFLEPTMNNVMLVEPFPEMVDFRFVTEE